MTCRGGYGTGDQAVRLGKGQFLQFSGSGPPPRGTGGYSFPQRAGEGGERDAEMGIGVLHRGEGGADADLEAQLFPGDPLGSGKLALVFKCCGHGKG